MMYVQHVTALLYEYLPGSRLHLVQLVTADAGSAPGSLATTAAVDVVTGDTVDVMRDDEGLDPPWQSTVA